MGGLQVSTTVHATFGSRPLVASQLWKPAHLFSHPPDPKVARGHGGLGSVGVGYPIQHLFGLLSRVFREVAYPTVVLPPAGYMSECWQLSGALGEVPMTVGESC